MSETAVANSQDWTVKVHGQPLAALPKDLYIPPDALEVFLETFEGPLDLLLYLIRRQNIDILDIPVCQITTQYMDYIRLMQHMRFELAAEYLVMAAMLAEIKSRLLLPRPASVEDEEEDPRAGLVQRLQEYERFKQAAEQLDAMPRHGREFWSAGARPDHIEVQAEPPQPSLQELLESLRDVLQRAELFASHEVAREPLSVRERMGRVIELLKDRVARPFSGLVDFSEGRAGVVVCFLAVLELARTSMIEVHQPDMDALPLIRLAGPMEAA